MQASCDAWNKANPEGAKVRYWPGVRTGPGIESETYSDADILGGHTAGVYVRGCGFVALTHVEPVRGEV